MAKYRLNMNDRAFLRNLAAKTVNVEAEQAAADAAYKACAAAVRAAVEKKYPPADMAVLKKYDSTREDRCIRLNLAFGGVVGFDFRNDDTPWPVRPTGYFCTTMYPLDEAATRLYEAHKNAEEALVLKRERIVGDFDKLISHSKTLEEIETVWPGASKLRERIKANVPVTLSQDVVERIKATLATAEGGGDA